MAVLEACLDEFREERVDIRITEPPACPKTTPLTSPGVKPRKRGHRPSPQAPECHRCERDEFGNAPAREVIALGPVTGTDPTQTYRPSCGHTVF
jgi:hypothetical protein